MSTMLEKCEQQAKYLPLQERALLIKHLVEDLDELDELDLEHLWVQEATRRFQRFKAGEIEARSSEDVFRDARIKLQEL